MKFAGSNLKLGTGLAVGAGVLLLAPVVFPVVGSIFKSLTKATIKGGLIAAEKTRIGLAEAKETLEDLAAEAKAEIAEKQEARSEVE
jgi:hypothetical protein